MQKLEEKMIKLFEGGSLVLIIVAIAAVIGFASSKWLGDDNFIEESAEFVIKHHTGFDVDLTPDSPEKK